MNSELLSVSLGFLVAEQVDTLYMTNGRAHPKEHITVASTEQLRAYLWNICHLVN